MDRSLCFVLLGIFGSVFVSEAMAVCPYKVPGCQCTQKTLLCKNLTDVPPLVYNNEDGSITNLTFQYGNLSSITRKNLPANLHTLIFSDVSITSISPDAFSNSSNSLTSFSMSKLSYHELPDALLKVNGLTELKLTNVNVIGWKTAVFQYVGKTVRSVSLVKVGFTSWPDWLKDFTFVNSVNLSSNVLESIPADVFTKVNNLTTLVLRSTSLENETNLNVALTPTRNTLEYLDIESNLFDKIPSSLVNMTRLSNLQASFNLISEISADRIPQQLKILSLINNPINYLTDTSFPRPSALKTLILIYCRIYDISDLAFQPLENLTSLYLSVSALTKIPQALTKLPNLKVLGMQDTYSLTCYCPRNETLVRWYQSQKGLIVLGKCRSNSNTVDITSYLDVTSKLACSGFRFQENMFLNLLFVVFAYLA